VNPRGSSFGACRKPRSQKHAAGRFGSLACRYQLSAGGEKKSLERRYGRRKALELILVCSHFNMVSRILESTRVEVEPENFLATWKMPQ
jgi:hypothetical protein